MITQAAILVGGHGIRLGTLTEHLPKPLLPCGDRPFLAWVIHELSKLGVQDIVLLTGHLGEVVEATLPDLSAMCQGVRISCNCEPIRAGTGGALYFAHDRLHERFYLCNGDSWFQYDRTALQTAIDADDDDVICRMVLRSVPDASRYGVAVLDRDRVTAFQTRPSDHQPALINGGFYVMRRSMVRWTQPVCSLERDILPVLASQGSVRGTVSDGYFIDIGIPTDYRRAQDELPRLLGR